MSNINFDNAWWLLLAVPLIVLFTVGFAVVTRKENVNGHSIASYVLHILMAVIVAFAAAGTTITSVLTETNVYVVADVSYSTNKNLDAIDGYIRNLELPRNSKLGVVCFGKEAEVLSAMGDPKKVRSVKNSNVDDSETNIAEALEYTATLFKTDVIKRIVLITDGRYTDESDSYAINRAVDNLDAQGIRIDAIYLDSNIKVETKEVQISGVEYTRTAFLNSEETAKVTVQTTYEVDAVLTLYLDGEKRDERAVHLPSGNSVVDFDLSNYTLLTGTFDYEVRIEVEEDENQFNNSYLFTQVVSNDIKILVITQNWDDVVTVVERYGTKASIDVYEYDDSVYKTVKDAFVKRYAGNDKINIKGFVDYSNYDIPFTMEALCKYDEIILADVNLTEMVNYYEFVVNLNRVVSVFGKSLVTMGNLHIQNSGDPALKLLETMLPVSYGGNDDNKLYTLIIDTSRSMNMLWHLDVAKELCSRIIDILNDDDEICVVTFDADVRILQPVKPLTSRSDVINAINKLDVKNGTVIGRGLDEAYKHIRDYSNGDKQVMLITDGLSYSQEYDDPLSVVKTMYGEGIVTSVFDVGRQGDLADGKNTDPTAQRAKSLLESIARSGHGTYTYSSNEEKLPDLSFGKVAGTITKTIIEKVTSVNAARRADDVLKDITTSMIPDVSGYVYSNIKPSAINVLTVNHERSLSETTPKPLYAYWSFGNGKVSTFTSQMNGKWIDGWSESGLLNRFIDNIFTCNKPETKSDAPFKVDMSHEGKRSYVEVTPAVAHTDTDVVIEIIKPDGEIVTKEMQKQADNSYFSCEFDIDQIGKYAVTITYTYFNKDYVADATFSISYSPEYNAFAVYDIAVLHKALDGKGGQVVENKSLKIENDSSQISTYSVKLTVPLMIAAVVMFVVDIVIRKLKWNDIKSFFSFFKRRKYKEVKE